MVDETTGAPMLLVTVVVSSPALQGTQSEFTDDGGRFVISGLPIGSYTILFIYGDAKVKREDAQVSLGKTTVVNAKINTHHREVSPSRRRRRHRAGSTNRARPCSRLHENVPNRGRTWQGVLGAAGGAQGDQFGTSFSGSTSIENSYVVDGVNTSGVTLGAGYPTQGSAVLNNFIQEIEVITGGYNAEFGRSTGGVVNVVTKTGSNEFHGSVFANVQALNAGRRHLGRGLGDPRHQPAADDHRLRLRAGRPHRQGPAVVLHRLRAGHQPLDHHPRDAAQRRSQRRQLRLRPRRLRAQQRRHLRRRRRSRDHAGAGLREQRQLRGRRRPRLRRERPVAVRGDRSPATSPAQNTYQVTSKLNFALAPEHQGQIGLTGTPFVGNNLVTSVFGTPTFGQRNERQLNTDAAAKWTSKFMDNRTQLDVIAGWHRFSRDAETINETLPGDPLVRSADVPSTRITDFTSQNGLAADAAGPSPRCGAWAANRDVARVAGGLQACEDGGTGDRTSGSRTARGSQWLRVRIAGRSSIASSSASPAGHPTQRVKAPATTRSRPASTSRERARRRAAAHGGYIQSTWPAGRALAEAALREDQRGGDELLRNRWAGSSWSSAAATSDPYPVNSSHYLGTFLQDSWSILPNLTINAGLRYEQQYLKYAEQVQNTIDPITMQPVGANAMELKDLWAPRLGVVYDWTKEGRSKVYANFGRFYESIPMDINNRAFGGEVLSASAWNSTPAQRDNDSSALPVAARGLPQGNFARPEPRQHAQPNSRRARDHRRADRRTAASACRWSCPARRPYLDGW